MVKKLKKAAALVLALALSVSTVGTGAYTEAKAATVGTWDGVTTANVYVGENFKVTFSLSGYWQGGYNAMVRLENTGSSVIENWYMSFPLNNRLTTIWNAEIVSNESGKYVVKNAGWNADIPVGGCVEFGISVNEDFNGFPSAYKLLGESAPVQEEDFSVEYVLDSDWGAGFTARMLLTNNTDKVLEDWTLEFDYNREITSIWNGVIQNHEGNHYVIKNAGYNANVVTGSAISFGFNGVGGTASDVPGNFKVISSSYDVFEEEDTEGTGEEDGYKDTDGDGLADELENFLETDVNNKDTDGDGLSDYEEVYLTDTDPIMADSDEDGVLDPEEDEDEDGLIITEELAEGTDCDDEDTDGDSLSDGQEVKVLGTNPLSADTDEDGLTDDEELRLGLDPKNPMTDGVTPDGKRTFVQSTDDSVKDAALKASDNWLVPGITGTVAGDITKNICMYDSSVYALEGNRSVVSDFVEITTAYETPVTLTFRYTAAYIGDINNLNIMTYTEDGLTPLDTVIDEANGEIRGEISASGVYFVMDLDEFLKGLGIDVFGNISAERTPEAAMFSLRAASAEAFEEAAATEEPEYITVLGNEAVVAEDAVYDVIEGESGVSVEIEEEAVATTWSLMTLRGAAPTETKAKGAKGKADVVFVIDTTGSMSGAISGVKNNIAAFSKALVDEYNIDVNFALYEYRDITVDGLDSTILHNNLYSNWYTNVNTFIDEVNSLRVNGGGDYAETPIDGLELARVIDWRRDAVKFVILVTDATYKTNNLNGIADMYEMADLMVESDIITSAIAASESHYDELVNPTGGLYGYIYGNFSTILLQLADMVGEETNAGGDWVLLSDYQAVKLSDTLENAETNDTDGDGYSDAKELGTSKEVDMRNYITRLLNRYELPEEYYIGKTTLEVWEYVSNPTLVDTDFDGISDGTLDYDGSATTPDTNPKRMAWSSSAANMLSNKDGNRFRGEVTANGYTFDVSFKMDYSMFFDTLSVYNRDLSKLGIIYSIGAYHNKFTIDSGANFTGDDEAMMKQFGMKDVTPVKLADTYTDDDISEITMGHRKVTYQGVTKEIVFVTVRGTDATIEEWSSNFDVGSNTDAYWDRNNVHWENKQNHKGFDVAANRLDERIQRYVNELGTDTPKVIFFTGHSRGAAIANILASMYVDRGYETVAYTMATPNTTLEDDTDEYITIFNVVNSDDLVPYLPLEEKWGYTKYGITYEVSIEEDYENKWFGAQEGTWENVFGDDYNYNGNLKDTLKAFKKVADGRDDLYVYTGESNTEYTYKTKYYSKAEAEAAAQDLIDRYGTRISRFAKFYTVETDPWIGKTYYQVMVEQTPAAMMMILTDVVASKQHVRNTYGIDEVTGYAQRGADEDTFFGQDIGFYVAKKYKDAKKEFVWSGADSAADIAMTLRMGGMLHSHMPGTYYLIADDYQDLLP